MSEKRDCTMMDQASYPVPAFYEAAADKFRDTSFVAKVPAKFCHLKGTSVLIPMI
jgi:hypothetical protein